MFRWITFRGDNVPRVTNEGLGFGICDGEGNGGLERRRRPALLPLLDFCCNCGEIRLVVDGVVCGGWQRG